MADKERKSVFEWFRPSREIREATPAGDRYVEGKTGVQFLGGLDGEIRDRITKAKVDIEAYSRAGHRVKIREEDGKRWQLREFPPTLSEMIREAQDWLCYLQAIQKKKRGENALQYVPELTSYLENDVFKTGVQSVTKKISEDDELLAATLSEAPL